MEDNERCQGKKNHREEFSTTTYLEYSRVTKGLKHRAIQMPLASSVPPKPEQCAKDLKMNFHLKIVEDIIEIIDSLDHHMFSHCELPSTNM